MLLDCRLLGPWHVKEAAASGSSSWHPVCTSEPSFQNARSSYSVSLLPHNVNGLQCVGSDALLFLFGKLWNMLRVSYGSWLQAPADDDLDYVLQDGCIPVMVTKTSPNSNPLVRRCGLEGQLMALLRGLAEAEILRRPDPAMAAAGPVPGPKPLAQYG